MHGLELHLYADDTQVYISFCPASKSDTDSAVRKINARVAGIRTWMIQNRLQFNNSKLEALLMCAPHMRSILSVLHLEVSVSRTVPSDVVRNIGAFFDQNLNMQHHFKQLCRKASFQLWNIGRMRHLLNAKTTETLVHSYVTSRLDCGNVLLHGVPEALLRQPQSVQNTAAHIATGAGKQAHSKDLLEQLHWLPVSFPVGYKIILLTFRALRGLAPVYLSQLLTVYSPTRTLRSHSQLLLHQPKSRLKTCGDRAFSHAAPRLWNVLPRDLRAVNCLDDFKINLKTYLFKKAFHRLDAQWNIIAV